MINSVSPYEKKNNPFATVSNRVSSTDYWLKEREVKEDFTINDVLTPEKARKTHNAKAIGISIAGAVITISGIALLLLKGGPKGLTKSIEKLRMKYLEKLESAKLKGEESSKKAEFIFNKLNYFAQKAEAVNNITTMKDYAFKRIMFVLGTPTRKAHEKITQMFEKLGIKTVEDAYNKTAQGLLQTKKLNTKLSGKISSENLDEVVTIKGESLTRREWLEKLKTLNDGIEATFNKHFCNERRGRRLEKMREHAQELEKSFDASGPLWFLSKDTFKTFVAEQKMHANKIHIQKPIKSVRKEISCTKDDIFKEANEKITKISSSLSFGETETIKSLNTLKNDWKNFAKGGTVTKEQIIKDIDDFSKNLLHSVPSPDKARIDAYNEAIKLKELIRTSQSGKVEEILDIYKALLPENEFKLIKKSYDKSVKSLDKSIALETEEFVNKLRDLTMGSAPTDILTNLIGVGTLAYYLGKSDNNQERMGIALKYGFPALTLIGMCLYGNAKLFAGSKSLLFGIVSSAVVNRIGTAANELLLKHFEKKNAQRSE